MAAVKEYAPKFGMAPMCRALGMSRTTVYRSIKRDSVSPVETSRPTPKRALSESERRIVLNVMHEKRFEDLPPHQVYATLLDEGTYLCSIRTIYRILEENGEIRERRKQLKHPAYQKPELLATRPNEIWSWDITKLKGPAKWTYFYLYVILDIFSRYVVGWMVAERESSILAERLIKKTCLKQGIAARDRLTLHADRGSSMKSKCVAMLLSDLGVTKTHGRPHVSNDNPFSESQFKTLKYRPEFPDRFGSIQDARSFCSTFFNWYNFEHHHSGIALLTPYTVHYGLADEVTKIRQVALDLAYATHPERFVKRAPIAPMLPGAVWINPPSTAPVNHVADEDIVEAMRSGSKELILEGVIAP
jgi:putative transposase